MIPKTNPTVIRGHKGADQDFLGGGWWWVVRGMDCLLKRGLGFKANILVTLLLYVNLICFSKEKRVPGPCFLYKFKHAVLTNKRNRVKDADPRLMNKKVTFFYFTSIKHHNIIIQLSNEIINILVIKKYLEIFLLRSYSFIHLHVSSNVFFLNFKFIILNHVDDIKTFLNSINGLF